MSCSPLHARVRVHALKDGKIGSTCRERERERELLVLIALEPALYVAERTNKKEKEIYIRQ